MTRVGVEEPLQWLIIAGPECQDFSPAGANRGLYGTRARVFAQVLSIISAFQRRAITPPLHIVENAAMQHNWRSEHVRTRVYGEVCAALGPPVLTDAPPFGSYSHRLRNFWTNIADVRRMNKAVQELQPPTGTLAQDILDPGRFVTPVERSDRHPFHLSNRVGQPRRVFPTLVAYPMSRAFQQGCPGAVYDSRLGWTEPNPDERERILGFATGTTKIPGITESERHRLTGNAIDLRVLTGLIRMAALLLPTQTCRELSYNPVPPAPRTTTQYKATPPPQGKASVLSLVLALQAADGEYEQQLDEDAPSTDVAVDNQPALHIQESMAKAERFHTRNRDNDPLDITQDEATLEYLRRGVLPAGVSTTSLRRLLRRGAQYKYVNDKLYRRMSNGQLRQVPPIQEREAIVKHYHSIAGHFGKRRTLYLLMATYTWPQMAAQVRQLVRGCELCHRARASFSAQPTELHPHPVTGLFHTWGVDLSGPYTKSKRGYRYLFHAVEHQIHLMVTVPIVEKDSTTTAYVFMQHIICQYGACASVVTDSGKEFMGDFETLCVTYSIDHRVVSTNNPQGNGLTERAVGTVKRNLSKMMEEKNKVDDWDYYAIRLTLAYNLSPQETLGIAPFYLLYAREPLFPSDSAQPFTRMLMNNDWSSGLATRAQYLERVMPTVANHLAIAKHRDTLRYAFTRNGAYRPQAQRFQPGGYVYVRRPQDAKVQLKATPKILRIKRLTKTGTVELEGRCGQTGTTHVRNIAPCYLPHIDGTIVPGLARPTADHPCEVCKSPDRGGRMLLCDACNAGYHLSCLVPPLTRVPATEWYCPSCQIAGHTAPATTADVIEQAKNKQKEQRAFRALHRRR